MLSVNVLGEGSCYHRVIDRKWTAMLLLNQAYRMYESVDIFKKLDDLKLVFRKRPKPILSEMMRITKQINTLLDALKIVSCFESAFKAELLMKGYIVHWIDNNKNKALRKTQSKSPIKINKIKRLEGLTNSRSNDYKFELLLDKTIPFSVFLHKDSYQKILKYPLRSFLILNRINRTRNTLHFINQGGSFYSNSILEEYSFLNEVVRNKIVEKHNRLVRQGKRFGYSTSSMIVAP